MSIERQGNGQRFHFRLQGVKFVGTWEQVKIILASMDTATVPA